MSARNRELLALVPAALLVTAGFAADLRLARTAAGRPERHQQVSDVSLTYGGDLPRRCASPRTSSCASRCPTPTPTCSRSSRCWRASAWSRSTGSTTTLARQQAQWFVIGLALFAATIVLLRDYRKLERYRYLIALGGIGLLLLPRAVRAGQRRLPGDPRRLAVGAAGGVREDRDRRLPGQLPARHAPAAGARVGAASWA